MRGPDGFTESMFTVLKLDDFVPKDHPLRPIRAWLNDALKRMDDVFARMYEADAKGGRPSIAPEKLVRALLLQVLYSIRSERMVVEQISYNMLFRWFVGLPMDGTVWDHSTFSKNRDRLLEHDVVVLLFNETVETARERGHLSGEHFSVDGTLIQAWAGIRALWRKQVRTKTTHLLTNRPRRMTTGMDRSAVTRRTNPRRTSRRVCFARAKEPGRCSVIWAMC